MKRPVWLIVIVVAWFALIMLGLYWLLQSRLTWFDEQGLLHDRAAQPSFNLELARVLGVHRSSLASTVFHIIDADCHCNWRSQGHQSAIKRLVKRVNGYNQILTIQDHPELRQFIPATPAIVMYNEKSQLIYLGPYADGAFCNSRNSFVESLIPTVVGTDTSLLGWVNTVAKGCYCPT